MDNMKKFVYIPLFTGKSVWKYQVNKGDTLLVMIFGYTSFDALITVTLKGAGASAVITGILIGNGNTKQILHTMQIHKAKNTKSNLLVKTVLSGEASCLYDGGIRVEKKAQKADAYQRNENLLLSDHAYAESKPSLEILANDVRCTHGATVSTINEEQLWYLVSRGISVQGARRLISEGFIQSALERIGDRDVKRSILSLWQRTSKR